MDNQNINLKAKEIPPKKILKELFQFGSYNIFPVQKLGEKKRWQRKS